VAWTLTRLEKPSHATLSFGQASVLGTKELWKTRAPNNFCFFVWLVMLDRCWTAECLHRHGIRSTVDCILCCQHMETIDHLVMQCAFTHEVWFKSLRCYSWQHLAPSPNRSFALWWTSVRKRVPHARRRAFDSFAIAVAWGIWTHPNDRTFRSSTQSAAAVVDSIWFSMELWCQASIVVRSQLLPI
jgi:hypothetical protein